MRRVLGLALSIVSVAALAACTQSSGLNVEKVEPPQGTVNGGEEITLVGSGFTPGKTQAEVRFGRKKADNVIIASNSKIKVVTPPGEKGPVDISVMFDDGNSFKIPGGFRYMEPAAQDNARKAFFSGQKGGATDKPGGIEIEKK